MERIEFAAWFVSAADDWRFGRLYYWQGGKYGLTLSPRPISRFPNGIERVNMPLSDKEEVGFKRAITCNQPFVDDSWVESTAKKYDHESTLRHRDRIK